jgi:hypothetical protein
MWRWQGLGRGLQWYESCTLFMLPLKRSQQAALAAKRPQLAGARGTAFLVQPVCAACSSGPLAICTDSACAIEPLEPAAGDIPAGLTGEHWFASANGAEHPSARLACSFALQSARWAAGRPAGLLAMATCARPCSCGAFQCPPLPCCAPAGKAPAIPRPLRRRGACR